MTQERKKEVMHMRKFDILKAILLGFTLGGTTLVIFCTFLVIVYTGINLNLGETMLVINCLLTIQFFIPLGSVLGLGMIYLFKLTLRKIEGVLLMPEYENENNLYGEKLSHHEKIAFTNKIISVTILEDTLNESNQLLEEERLKTEESQQVEYGLNKVNFEINPGELVMVIGKVGSGKSSLLLHLLSELDNSKFNINTPGNISYYSEDP